jgi:hypothetical protein
MLVSLDFVVTTGIVMAKIATLVAIPLIYLGSLNLAHGWQRGRGRGPAHLRVWPEIWPGGWSGIGPWIWLTHGCGVWLGLALLYFSSHAHDYSLDLIFVRDGPWSVDFATFLGERANPLIYHWAPIYQAIVNDGDVWLLQSFAVLFAALSGVVPSTRLLIWDPGFRVPLPLPLPRVEWMSGAGLNRALRTYWRPATVLRAGLFSLVAILGTALIFVYLVNAIYWSLNILNVWSLLLLAVLFQRYRHGRSH